VEGIEEREKVRMWKKVERKAMGGMRRDKNMGR